MLFYSACQFQCVISSVLADSSFMKGGLEMCKTLDSGKNILALRVERPREKGFPSFPVPQC